MHRPSNDTTPGRSSSGRVLTVLVTGGGSGLAHALAEAFEAAGCRCFHLHRHGGGPERPPAPVALLEEDVVGCLVERVWNQAGRVDAVINCSSLLLTGAVEDTTGAEAERHFARTVLGVHLVCRAALPLLRSQGSGLLVNLSERPQQASDAFMALYAASQDAIRTYTEALTAEAEPDGVRVVLHIHPGVTRPTLDDRMESRQARHAPHHWDRYKEAWTRVRAHVSPASAAALADEVRGRVLRELEVLERSGPARLPGRTSSGLRPGLPGFGSWLYEEAELIQFSGPWTPSERRHVEQAILEAEIVLSSRDAELDLPRWTCTLSRSSGHAVYGANRYGWERVLRATSAEALAGRVLHTASMPHPAMHLTREAT